MWECHYCVGGCRMPMRLLIRIYMKAGQQVFSIGQEYTMHAGLLKKSRCALLQPHIGNNTRIYIHSTHIRRGALQHISFRQQG